jgi:hypothetical protein
VRYHAHLIKWSDSFGPGRSGWRDIEDVPLKEYHISTIGFVIHRTKKLITVTTCIAHNGMVMDPFTIPTRCILTMRRLPQFVQTE